ncbi:MAG TPA: endonuclease III [Syntrophobacteria bacterium]|nr:endonuclease III [Syntrophobacteria bacterium]
MMKQRLPSLDTKSGRRPSDSGGRPNRAVPEATEHPAVKALRLLAARYGNDPWNWHTQQTPFQVLIGTVLSQRTRDEKTDAAARALFFRYPSPEALAVARVEEIEALIRPVNYYRTKAKRIHDIGIILLARHKGRTPDTIAELMNLPGVGRKTASCVMVYGFGRPALPVDTHVHRIANRIGLVRTRVPEETERALCEVLPGRHLMSCNELMVKHGQTICRPRSPKCGECPLASVCLYASTARERSHL